MDKQFEPEENISSFQITPKHIENEVNSVIENIYNKFSHKKEDAELLVHKVSEFLSKKFFVVMLGAIKAGKSTLVNSLVGREISPMGAGFETTLRSSIIIAADKNHPEGLYVYSFTQDQKNKLKEKIESLERKKGNVDGDVIKDNVKKEWWQSRMAEYFAYLGEINPEFEKKYQCYKHEFKKDVIVEILTKEKVPLDYGYNDEESLPLLISIDTSKFKEQKVNLLNCQCAIIDTPGLDGAKANNQTDSLLKAANQYADYFLFIQSSMSALTGGCKKYLEENKQIPKVAVYNKMSSSYWYDEKSREAFENNKATVAYENLRNCTPYTFDIGYTVVVNAGAAWEAISRKNTDKIAKYTLSEKYSGEEGLTKLLNESGLPEYIQELTKKIKETRIKIKVENARSKVIQEIKALDKKYDDELSEEIKDKENEIASLEEENKDIRAVKHKFDNDWLAEKLEHERVCYALSGNIKAKVKACIKESMDNNGVKAPTYAESTSDAIKKVKHALEQIKNHFYDSLKNDLAIQNDKFNSNSQVFIDSYNQQIFNENLDDVKKYIDNIASLQDKVINDLTFTEIDGILNQYYLTMPNDGEIEKKCLEPWICRWKNVIDEKNTAAFVEEIGDCWQSSVDSDSLYENLRTKIRDIICAWGSEAVDDKLDRKISDNNNKIVSFKKEIEGIKSELSNLKSILVEIKGKVEQIKVN